MAYHHENIDYRQFNYTHAYREHGNEQYLAPGETFESVKERDKWILDSLGVSNVDIGRSLRKLFSSFNDFQQYVTPGLQTLCPGIEVGRNMFELGFEPCPYIPKLTSYIDWVVRVDGLDNGNKAYHPKNGPTVVSDMLPDMIEQLGFFEGGVYYGIQPEWAAKVHQIIDSSDIKPYVPKYTTRAWSIYRNLSGIVTPLKGFNEVPYHNYLQARQVFRNKGNPWPVDTIRRSATHVEVVENALKAFVVNGDPELSIEPWSSPHKLGAEQVALLVAMRDVVLPQAATLMDLPFDKLPRSFKRGDIEIAVVFADTKKQIG